VSGHLSSIQVQKLRFFKDISYEGENACQECKGNSFQKKKFYSNLLKFSILGLVPGFSVKVYTKVCSHLVVFALKRVLHMPGVEKLNANYVKYLKIF